MASRSSFVRRVVEYQSFLAMKTGDALITTVLAGFNLPSNVLGFALIARSTVRRTTRSNTCVLKALSGAEATADFGRLVGDRIASAIVGSPFYPFLKKQAQDAMKECAEVSRTWHELFDSWKHVSFRIYVDFP